MFKNLISLILVCLIIKACNDQIKKRAKKGYFLYRKCVNCGLETNYLLLLNITLFKNQYNGSHI